MFAPEEKVDSWKPKHPADGEKTEEADVWDCL